MDEARIREFVAEYEQRLPRYEKLREVLTSRIETALNGTTVEVHQVVSRCKSQTSLHEKLTRKTYSDPWQEIMDLVGVRVIVFYDGDVKLAADAIAREFEGSEIEHQDKRESLESNQFGYRSYHLEIRLSDPNQDRGEADRYDGMTIEVQIRTLRAHAWAGISHRLAYKSDSTLRSREARLMSRVSAMLETADELFDELRHVVSEARTIEEPELPIELDHEVRE